MQSRLGHVKVPCLILTALCDQYIPPHVDVKALSYRIVRAFPKAESIPFQTNHELDGKENHVVFSIRNFLSEKIVGLQF